MVGRQTKVYLAYLGANVRKLRTRLGLTQEKLAEATDLDVRFIQRMEHGRVNLRFDTLVRLSECLKVDPGSLLERVQVIKSRPGRPKSR